MPHRSSPQYTALCQRFTRIYRFSHLQSMAYWDLAAMMPPGGHSARSEALAEMAGLLHQLRTDPALGEMIDAAGTEPLDSLQAANLREMRRQWLESTALPQDLVERRSRLTSACEHAWRQQRPANDWAGFLPNLQAVLEVSRECAQRLSDRLGLAPYDALMDQFEPGMTSQRVQEVFGEVRTWLPDLIRRVVDKQSREVLLSPRGPFPVPQQRALCEQVMRHFGFDFHAGRLDVSTHPFSGGVPEDVRLTTRFREDDFLPSLMGTVHETGHGRYQQNLPRDLLGQPVADARSMAIHESQSLSFEMQLGGHPGFAGLLSPLLVETFGDQAAFMPGNLHRLLTRVKPGYIRVDADEVTYPAHVMLRFDIERALIAGDAQAADIPALWDAGMQDLLGVDTRGNYRDGPMQDVHWPEGMFGYFPCYSLGAMYAAQWFATMRRSLPGLDERLAAGDFAPVFDWLKTHIWEQGSRWTTDELSQRASGEPLNPAHFRAHLEARYLG